MLTKQENLIAYLESAVAYVEYVLKYFSDKEANVMLKDVIVHVKGAMEGMDDAVYETQVMPLVKQVVELCLKCVPNMERPSNSNGRDAPGPNLCLGIVVVQPGTRPTSAGWCSSTSSCRCSICSASRSERGAVFPRAVAAILPLD